MNIYNNSSLGMLDNIGSHFIDTTQVKKNNFSDSNKILK